MIEKTFYFDFFIGWFTDKNAKSKFDFANSPISKNITLYAGWKSNGSNPSNPGSTTVNPTGVSITNAAGGKVTLNVKDSLRLEAVVAPSNATNKSVSWTSSNNDIVSVSDNGTITALKAGSATITVCSKVNKELCAKVSVTVNAISNYRIVLTHVDAGKFNPVLQFTYKVYKDKSEINNYSKFVIAGLEVGPKDYTISASRVNSEPSTATLILSDGTKIEKVPVTYE